MDSVVYIEVDEGTRVKCSCPSELVLHEGAQCVFEAEKILDFGQVAVRGEETVDPAKAVGMGRVVRRATLQDQAKANENALMSRMALKTCTENAQKHNLPMRLVRVRYSFDRAVLLVLFVAEERIDFREMVKELAAEFRTRVEMRQIGVRDEAGIIGGLGVCGRTLCCCSWLHHFASINVKMAKCQRVSLNPGAMGGMCGRLKCCLRFEYDGYREVSRILPNDGDLVQCPDGKGRVVDKNVLAQRVRVRLDDERMFEYRADEVHVIGRAPERESPRGHGDEDAAEDAVMKMEADR